MSSLSGICRESNLQLWKWTHLCGICVDRVKKCSICQGDASKLAPVPFIDRVLRSEGMMIPCRNEVDGCTLTVKPHEMKNHLAKFCDFRPIKCWMGLGVGAESTNSTNSICKSYSPWELHSHYVDVHKMIEVKVVTNADTTPVSPDDNSFLGSISRSHSLSPRGIEAMKKLAERWITWCPGYFKLDGQTFIIHTQTRVETTHTWITLVGSESVANGYKYCGRFKSNYTETNILKHKIISFPEIPVHCLQFIDFEKVDAIGDVMSIRHNNLKTLMNKQSPVNSQNVYEWIVEFRIFKCINFAGNSTILNSSTI